MLEKNEPALLRPELQLQGVMRVFRRSSDSDPWVYHAQFHNTLTRNLKQQVLNSLAQAVGNKLSASSYIQRICYLTGTAPNDVVKENLDINGASALSWEPLTVAPPLVVTGTKDVTVEFESIYTALGTVTVNFIALVNSAEDYSAENVFSVIKIAPYILAAGESMKMTYELTYNLYTGYQVEI